MMITVLTKAEARFDQQEKVLDDQMRFSRKALDEIYRLSSVQQPMIASSSSSQSAEEEMSESDRELYFHNGTNLLKVPGGTAAEKAHEIVKILWSEQERKVLCIDPKRELSKDRVASDELRTEKFRSVLKKLFPEYDHTFYQGILKLVNQRLREKRDRKSRSLGN